MHHSFLRAAARMLVLPLTVSLFLSAPPAANAEHVFTPAPGVSTDARTQAQLDRSRERAKRKPVGERAIAAARSRAGMPYRYGAAGPHAFDCSGLTQWAFRKAGKRLPRTSGAQVGATRRVAQPRRGDLVFFTNGGRVYHVGIYAGRHTLWHSSRPGTPVRKDRIWSSSVFYGRVR